MMVTSNLRMSFKMRSKGEASDNYCLYIYDEINPDGVNCYGDAITSPTDAKRISEELEKIPDGSRLNVYISSNGGDVRTGLAIYAALKRKNCKKTAYIDGFACSIASVIPMACDEVIMNPTSLMMIHNASGFCFGNAEEHRKFAEELEVISSSAVTAYLEKAGSKLDKAVLYDLLNKESWLNAEQCLKYGLCDKVDSVLYTPMYRSGNEDDVKQHFAPVIVNKGGVSEKSPEPECGFKDTEAVGKAEMLARAFTQMFNI